MVLQEADFKPGGSIIRLVSTLEHVPSLSAVYHKTLQVNADGRSAVIEDRMILGFDEMLARIAARVVQAHAEFLAAR